MHRLYPLPAEPINAAHAAGRQRAPHADRPWVMLNMIASIDGAAAIDGLSGGLSSESDKTMFGALRAQADTILVGARTANAERYRPARRSGARIAVVSGSLSVDPDLPLFSQPPDPPSAPLPLVVTTVGADCDAAERLADRAELVRAGAESVDLHASLRHLESLGARVVLCEGGPALNASLLAADLVDEVNLTHAPLAVGTDAPRIASAPIGGSPAAPPRAFALEQVIAHDDVLFVRWVRSRS
ncbi:MAG: pyrimidine reductase family protein [Acidimicrobiales bacterium]|uniref:dihydrofolate reductase family protein n=1 Tax=Candidatus Poriferisodalis multihospitum TaxID=2983191 RepID=UPI00137EC3A5|nr:dihydrofolate reductase family protein [Candidatus Poriferisodalis multihospitum]MCY3608936.1 dihydrofolate reductase family protein [Acidimicrobiaceae bacterium]MXV86156.1 pyrimidine reductase family protein [Acidimicrobiales bacterium]MYA83272.1 pyrimidine reductase family protein [Acidimicrobiales bacterium]MYB81231.1 pyrimidine reductase family protein [Acidimicrobiales bacterium]MYH75846.1 pyrimidine reductase family protein [Acidimicrobiales bacterium]